MAAATTTLLLHAGASSWLQDKCTVVPTTTTTTSCCMQVLGELQSQKVTESNCCCHPTPTASCCMQVLGELQGQKVTAVAAGREHALAVTTSGHVYSWGGRREVAGRAKGTDLASPGRVLGALENDHVLFVAAGEVRGGEDCKGGEGGVRWRGGPRALTWPPLVWSCLL